MKNLLLSQRHEFNPWVGKIPWKRMAKYMATHASIAWAVPWTEEPGGLQTMGSQKSWTQIKD